MTNENQQNETEHSNKFYKTIFNNINDSISIIDTKNYKIIDANQNFLDKLGLKREDVIGKTCYEITHNRKSPCIPPENACPLKETLETGKYATKDHMHPKKDGGIIYVEVSTSPIKDEKGEVVQVVHVARNISDRIKRLRSN